MNAGLLAFDVNPCGGTIGGLKVPVLDALPAAVCFRVPEAGLGGMPCLRLILSILCSKVSSSCKAYLFDGV